MSCQSGSSYIVESGDTLYTIAEEELGNGDRSNEIKNPDGSAPNPDNLQPGQDSAFLRSPISLPIVVGT